MFFTENTVVLGTGTAYPIVYLIPTSVHYFAGNKC